MNLFKQLARNNKICGCFLYVDPNRSLITLLFYIYFIVAFYNDNRKDTLCRVEL